MSGLIVLGLAILMLYLLVAPETIHKPALHNVPNVGGTLTVMEPSTPPDATPMNNAQSDVVTSDSIDSKETLGAINTNNVKDIDPNDLPSELMSEENPEHRVITSVSSHDTQLVEQPNKTLPQAAELESEQIATTKPEQNLPSQAVKQNMPNVLITETNLPDTPRTILHTHLELDGKKVLFTFTANEKPELKTFVLPDPERVVLDINGQWNIEIPKIISNFMLADIRKNVSAERTRLVFDMNIKTSKVNIEEVYYNTFQLTIR